MTRRRVLSPAEAALWRKVASSVTPLVPARHDESGVSGDTGDVPLVTPPPKQRAPDVAEARRASDVVSRLTAARSSRPPDRHGLDSGWERKLARGLVDPDFTLDLHGATLDAAHARLGQGLQQARTMDARVVLLITGRPRPVDAADRGRMRGAIRAKIGDWITAGEHGGAIAAIRVAHRRHGGPGALYLILRRRR